MKFTRMLVVALVVSGSASTTALAVSDESSAPGGRPAQSITATPTVASADPCGSSKDTVTIPNDTSVEWVALPYYYEPGSGQTPSSSDLIPLQAGATYSRDSAFGGSRTITIAAIPPRPASALIRPAQDDPAITAEFQYVNWTDEVCPAPLIKVKDRCGSAKDAVTIPAMDGWRWAAVAYFVDPKNPGNIPSSDIIELTSGKTYPRSFFGSTDVVSIAALPESRGSGGSLRRPSQGGTTTFEIQHARWTDTACAATPTSTPAAPTPSSGVAAAHGELLPATGRQSTMLASLAGLLLAAGLILNVVAKRRPT